MTPVNVAARAIVGLTVDHTHVLGGIGEHAPVYHVTNWENAVPVGTSGLARYELGECGAGRVLFSLKLTLIHMILSKNLAKKSTVSRRGRKLVPSKISAKSTEGNHVARDDS